MKPLRLLTAAATVLAAGLAIAPSARAAFDAFLKIEGVPAESKTPGRSGWIEVHSYHWVTPPPAPPPAPAPAGVARKGPGSISFVKSVDKASPFLSKAAAAGRLLPAVVVEVPRAGGQGPVVYMTYELKNVMVSSYSMSGQGSGDPLPSERMTFNFGQIELKYGEQKLPPKKIAAAPSQIAPVGGPAPGVGAVGNPAPSTGGSNAETASRAARKP